MVGSCTAILFSGDLLVVNQLPMLRGFSEVTIAPIVRAETSYAVNSMMMAVPVGVSSHNSTNSASSKVLGQLVFKHFLYSRIIRRFSATMGSFSFVAPPIAIRKEHSNKSTCAVMLAFLLSHRYTSCRLSDLMGCCLVLALQMAGHGAALQRRTMH
ncbi:hypothetical protein LI328DRAFT_115672 [Trichoderma asperelloides]|nr:hypothetical protein LI328DRAFT_115672 [Trichoderma asperelloides]